MTSANSDLRKRLGPPDKAVTVVLEKGETIWRLAGIKYNGKHPIAAIYVANKLKPTLEERDNKPFLKDPIYHSGVEYTFPADNQIEQLSADFWRDFDPRSVQERVGAPHERSVVCVRWDESLSNLSTIKYQGVDHSDAIFQVNGMVPNSTIQDGLDVLQQPIYQAGCSYIFPAVDEIVELEKQYAAVISAITTRARRISDIQDK